MSQLSEADLEAGPPPGEGVEDLLLQTRPSAPPQYHAAGTSNTSGGQGDGNTYEDWKLRGLLINVEPENIDEINRLIGLVDPRLHLAVEAEDLAAIRELMRTGASLAALNHAGMTPLHLCIDKTLIEPFKVLLSYEGSTNVMDASGCLVLHVAMLHRWRDGARAALAANADVAAVSSNPKKWPSDNMNKRYKRLNTSYSLLFCYQTPIHLAVMLNEMELLEEILTVAVQKNAVDCLSGLGDTALYEAIRRGNLVAIQALEMKGASVNTISDRGHTALHMAVYHPDILKYFLEKVPNSFDNYGYAPIHKAVEFLQPKSVKLLLDKFGDPKMKTLEDGKTALHLAATEPCNEAAEVILNYDLTTKDVTDNNGDTPLHAAAHAGNRTLVVILLGKGALLTTRGQDGKTVLEIIANTFLDPSMLFELVFDAFILNNKPVRGPKYVDVDYEVLTNGEDMSQIKVIEEFVRFGQSKVLLHPFIESLLYLKWRNFLPVFIAMLAVYATFLISFNTFVVKAFIYEDADINNGTLYNISSTNNTEVRKRGVFELYGAWYWLFIALIYPSIIFMIVQEVFFIYFKWPWYFAHLESWVKLLALFLGAAVPIAMSVAEPADWVRHAACAALLLSWLQAMFLLARFPDWGNYVLMFGKVAANLLKIFLTAILLLIGFSFSFMIQYRSTSPFDDPINAFVKTLVMMSSEFEYENMFNENHDNALHDTRTAVRLLFMLFVIFVAIVLMNFMIGVAVSDLNELSVTGNIKRLEKQVQLLSFLDWLVYDVFDGKLAKMFKNTFSDSRHHISLTIKSDIRVKWTVFKTLSCPSIMLYDPEAFFQFHCYTYLLPIHKAFIDIAKKKEDLIEENKDKSISKFQINALYDTVINKPLTADQKEGKGEREVNGSNWLREVISKQNDQMESLADNLLIVSNVVEQINCNFEELSSTVNHLKLDIEKKRELTAVLPYMKELISDASTIKKSTSNIASDKELKSVKSSIRELTTEIAVIKELSSDIASNKALTSVKANIKEITTDISSIKELISNTASNKESATIVANIQDLASDIAILKEMVANKLKLEV